MKEGQTCIYYGCGESVQRVLALPQAEALREKGYELLCLTDNVDEFALRVLENTRRKSLKTFPPRGWTYSRKKRRSGPRNWPRTTRTCWSRWPRPWRAR